MTERHVHKCTNEVVSRLSRIEGHVRAIKRMLKEGRPCPDVLIQLSAVKSAIAGASRVVLEDHIESCLLNATAVGTVGKEWQNLKEALDQYIT